MEGWSTPSQGFTEYRCIQLISSPAKLLYRIMSTVWSQATHSVGASLYLSSLCSNMFHNLPFSSVLNGHIYLSFDPCDLLYLQSYLTSWTLKWCHFPNSEVLIFSTMIWLYPLILLLQKLWGTTWSIMAPNCHMWRSESWGPEKSNDLYVTCTHLCKQNLLIYWFILC